jgi:Recombinase
LYGTTLYVKEQPSDFMPEGEIKSGLLALFAKYERAKTAERMRLGKIHRVRQGRPTSGFTPLGYAYYPDTRESFTHWAIVPEEAAIVHRIFEMCLDGMGIWAIARALTRERIPTKMDRSLTHRHEKQSAVGVWIPSSVSKILHDRNYVGSLQWGKTEAIETAPDRRHKPRNPRRPKTTKRARSEDQWIEIPIPQIIPSADIGRPSCFRRY